MSILGSLLHRDAEPVLPECGVMDGFVFQLDREVDNPALPSDVPCRDTASRRVAFRCPHCGQRTRAVCEVHEQRIARGLATCEVCEATGDHDVPVTFLQSGPVLGPQPAPTTDVKET